MKKKWLAFLFLLIFPHVLTSAKTHAAEKAHTKKIYWHTGTAAFISPYRLTLSDGRQYYLNKSVPIYLNGKLIPNLNPIKPGNSVIIRLLPKRDFISGIWAFHFPKHPGPSPDIFGLKTQFFKNHGKPFLKIQVDARAFGKTVVSAPGVFHSILLSPKKPGLYAGRVNLRQGMVIPDVFLLVKWSKGKREQSLIFPNPVSIYTEPPQISQINPENKKKIKNRSPFIFVTFNLKTPPVNPDTLQLFLDEKDVTHHCTRDSQVIFFVPPVPLTPGEHVCLIRGKGLGTGYPFQKKWSFQIEGTPEPKGE